LVSKNRIKFIQSLHNKKYRQKYGQFVVEGEKSVCEVINSAYRVDELFIQVGYEVPTALSDFGGTISFVSQTDLDRMSTFKNSSPMLAVVNVLELIEGCNLNKNSWYLACDDISDPGNLGTIIRIADWYGIKTVLCSANTVELYNPKTISSTMGSFTRCDVRVVDLSITLAESNLPVYLTQMDGEDLHQLTQMEPGIIVIGNEANGISQDVLDASKNKRSISIPRFGGAESLNAAVACGIVCDRLCSLGNFEL
jgi:TrmH family RNA methyltransferase